MPCICGADLVVVARFLAADVSRLVCCFSPAPPTFSFSVFAIAILVILNGALGWTSSMNRHFAIGSGPLRQKRPQARARAVEPREALESCAARPTAGPDRGPRRRATARDA